MEEIGFFIHAETLEAVSVGEFAERSILLGLERILEFVGRGHECHGQSIALDVAGFLAFERSNQRAD